jgi:hypothetical protein
VFPQKVDHLVMVLPPSMNDVLTPICVLFTGSSPPSEQWLRTHAQPLIVCREKVRGALLWLCANNPLYSDIVIDHAMIDTLAEHAIAPVSIDTQPPSTAETAQGS